MISYNYFLDNESEKNNFSLNPESFYWAVKQWRYNKIIITPFVFVLAEGLEPPYTNYPINACV